MFRGRGDRHGVPLLAALTVVACSQPSPVIRSMTLEDFRPSNRTGVYLNEDLVLTFSCEVDPATVTAQSVRVVSEDGEPARGSWEVQGRVIQFRPDPVLGRDLDDGGYRPDTRYRVVLEGFPRLDGLRGARGELFDGQLQLGFEIVAVAEPRTSFVFDDTSPGTAESLRTATSQIGPTDPIRLYCDEPLDPSTLFAEDFQLRSSTATVDLLVRLVANHDVGEQPRGQPCAVIELLPRQTLPPGDYSLHFDSDLRLRDFGGNPVWRSSSPQHRKRIRVLEAVRPEGAGELYLTFLDDARFSPIAVEGVDGTAHWSDTGQVRIRFLAAAGDGRDGHVSLAGDGAQRDVQAVDLHLPAVARASRSGPGAWVLRAQGTMLIAGRLVRSGSGGDGPMTFAEGEPLSGWLERVLERDPSWTVLIAGGDLVIDGSVEVDTPLLLAAGGRIRVQGRVRAREQQLWLLGDGGGFDVDPTRSPAQLEMDQPHFNPLRETLHVAAVSSPLPPWGRAEHWLSAQAGGRAGGGRWRVRYVPAGDVRTEVAVDHPRLLDGSGPIRLLIELEMPPGGAWDPPLVDFVRLTWDGGRD